MTATTKRIIGGVYGVAAPLDGALAPSPLIPRHHVIPAKAGTYPHCLANGCGIPAYAGMTGVGE